MTLTVTPGVVDATWADVTGAATLAPKLTLSFAVDDLLVVMVSSDNAGLNGAVTCIGNLTATGFGSIVKQQNALFDPLSAQNGAELAIFTAVCTSSRVTTDTVSVAFSPSPTSKCCVIWRIAGSGGALPAVGSSGVGTGANTGTPTVTTASVAVGDIAIGMISVEGRQATHPITGDADTTNGSWSTQLGTSAESGADASSMLIASQNKVQTTTPSTQTYNPTFTAADCIPGWITIVASVSGTDGTATPAAIDLSAVTPAPTASGNASTTPTAIALAATTPAPTNTGDANTTPAAVALSAVTPAPTASGGTAGDGEATPTAIALAAVTPTPTASGSSTTTPAAITRTVVTPAPTVTGGGTGGTATPAAVALVVTVPAPTASGTVGAALTATWGPLTGVIVADVSNRIEAVLTASW